MIYQCELFPRRTTERWKLVQHLRERDYMRMIDAKVMAASASVRSEPAQQQQDHQHDQYQYNRSPGVVVVAQPVPFFVWGNRRTEVAPVK